MSGEKIIIEVKPQDGRGHHLVTARMNGTSLPNRFDALSQFHRRQFRESVINRFGLDDSAHEWLEAEILSGAAAADGAALFKPVVKLLSTVTPKPVRWLWHNRIAIGKNNIFSGDPGLGKSLCALDIAARVSSDAGFPDGTHSDFGPAGIVILTMEDDPEDTICPRLLAANADLSRIALVQGVAETDGDGKVVRGIDLATDIASVREAVLQVPNCKLVIVDTIADYLGTKTDHHKNGDVRSTLNPFAAMANELGVANLLIAHLRKSEGKAVHSTTGSIAFVGQSRVAWAITRCPQNKKRRLMTCIKNNLADDTSGLAYTIENFEADGQPVLAWEAEPIRMSADEAMGQTRKPPGPKPDNQNAAADWLADYLASGEKLAGIALSDGEAAGHKAWTIRRAFKQLECTRRKSGFGDGWLWSLPEDDTDNAEDEPRNNLSPSSPSQNTEENTFPKTTNKPAHAKVTSSVGCVMFEDFERERKALANVEDVPW